MADQYQIILDVKLDLKERKQELWQLRNWVNCVVNIQAIKCFPCYLKISFYHEDDISVDHPFSVIRINIPGIKLENAASRTKNHTYGVFWKNNRKKCKMFFAFKERQDYLNHMDWLKNRIDSLEEYRKGILDNHRINRSIANQLKKVKVPSAGASSLNSGTQDEGTDKQTSDSIGSVRHMRDVLGPLPALPVNDECGGGRWSIRRTSGFSGIYEEILDEDDGAHQMSRASITSGIYVVMETPTDMISEQSIEIPPPLPPRRLLKHSNTNPDIDEVKHKRSAWHIIDNVFGRNKKSGTLARLHSQHSAELHTQIEIMCNKQNSFSTPDLTNIIETASIYNVVDIDSSDLEVMDIERSNSLNSAANQYLCRPPSLNISSNILWSHNLSSNLSAIGDSSVVNLVGADVNSEGFLSDDLSQYREVTGACIVQEVSVHPTNSEPTIGSSSVAPCRVIEDLSGYCQMAPIFNGNRAKDSLKRTPDDQSRNRIIAEDIVIGVSKRISYHEDDGTSLLDYSSILNDKHSSSRGSCHDENSSSGMSSDEGAIYVQSLNSATLENMKTALRLDIEPDDGISITCTESPTSPMATSPMECLPPMHARNKLDEKYPSYYPNSNVYSNPIDIKQPGNISRQMTSSPLRNLNLVCYSNHITPKMFIKNTPSKKQSASNKKQAKKSDVTFPMTSNRIDNDENSPAFEEAARSHKLKSKKQNNIRINSNPNAIGSASIESAHNVSKLKCNAQHSDIEMSGATSSLIGKTINRASTLPHKSAIRGTNQNQFSTLPKAPSSPKYIYRKCASFAQRIALSPTSSFDTVDSGNEDNTSMESTTKTSTESMNSNGTVKGNDITGSFRRFATLTRLRKFDFSPLKVKLTNILQRQNSDI